jgi:prepilin-type N-terminal cleavage/methylation domain-containing protein
MKFRLKKQRGFTLIELLVVISIVALLSGVVLSSLNTGRDRAKISAGLQFEANMYHAAGDMAVGLWNFDECTGTVVADSSGTANTGSLQNTPSWSADTPTGRGCSLSFNGSNQYIALPGNGFPFAAQSYSISAWVKPTAMAARGIIGWGDYVNNNATALRLGSNELRHYWYNNDIVASVDLANGKWHHVAVAYDGSTRTMYIDGVLVKSDKPSTSGRTFTTTNNVTIARTYTGEYFLGLIDSVRVYAKSLSAMEVRALALGF